MQESATLAAATASGSLTLEALRRHNHAMKSDVVRRDVFPKSDPGMSITSSMFVDSDIVHFDSDIAPVSLWFSFSGGQKRLSVGGGGGGG